MKLTVFNGSPRGQKSNTKILLDQFLAGFNETEGNESEITYLNHVKDQEAFIEKFSNAEIVLLAFPLYIDSMPAMVKTFIESLAPLRTRENNPPIAFIVQYGFQESIHGAQVSRYLEKVAERLHSPFCGIVTRGGVEGIQIQPAMMTNKLFGLFHELGHGFGVTGRFDPETVRKLTRKSKHSMLGRLIIRLMHVLKLSDLYWDQMLKKNNAYKDRYARPYQQ